MCKRCREACYGHTQLVPGVPPLPVQSVHFLVRCNKSICNSQLSFFFGDGKKFANNFVLAFERVE